jgi:hypothetical protein
MLGCRVYGATHTQDASNEEKGNKDQSQSKLVLFLPSP